MADALTLPVPQWRDLLTRQHLPYSILLAGGVALHAMNVFISITILPSAVREIGGLDYYAWSTTLFVLASIVSAALTPRIKASCDARNAYLLGLAIFMAGTVLCGTAGGIGAMNAGRAVQGFGGGMLYALAYILIRMVFPAHVWSVAVGLITVMWGVATFAGPAVGGLFAELGVWRAAFLSLTPVCLAFMVCVCVFFPAGEVVRARLDPVPVRQLTVIVALVLGVSMLSADPGLGEILAAIALTVSLGAAFLWVEGRSRARLLPRSALSGGSALGALYLTLMLLEIGMQAEAFVPYFLQHLHGQSPLVAGYIGALMAMGWTAASVVSARFTGARAEKTLIEGPVISFVGLALQAALLPAPSQNPATLAAVCLGLLLVGFGIGHCFPHVTARIYASAAQDEGDVAASAVTTVQLFAFAFGSAVAGMIANAAGLADRSGGEGTSAAAFWMCLLFLAAPAGAVVFAIRARARPSGRDAAELKPDVTSAAPGSSGEYRSVKGD